MDTTLLTFFGAGLGIGVIAAGIRLGYWLLKGDLVGK
jgi:hypothetical protein